MMNDRTMFDRQREADATREDRAALVSRPAAPVHIVQFYETEAFLVDRVSEFLGAGLAAQEALVVIATAPHWEAFAGRLRGRGFKVDEAQESGQLTRLDAHETLAGFMVGGLPDNVLFDRLIGGQLARAAEGRGSPTRLPVIKPARGRALLPPRSPARASTCACA